MSNRAYKKVFKFVDFELIDRSDRLFYSLIRVFNIYFYRSFNIIKSL